MDMRRVNNLPCSYLRLLTLYAPLALLGCGTVAAPDTTADAGAASMVDAGNQGAVRADRCTAVRESIEQAGFSGVTVSCDADFAWISSDTYPSHDKMTGITGTNDQVPVPAPGYRSPVKLEPKLAAQPTSIDAALGIAVNGVPIYDYTSQNTNDLAAYDPRFDTKLTGELDHCNGHSGRGDDYHYHAEPTCMMDAMKNKGPAAIIGWAFDGYPIYGKQNPDGSAIAPGTLNVCNGQPDDAYGFRYHASDKPPYIIQCLSGEFDLAQAPRVPPLSGLSGGGRPPGQKPPGGVQNLKLVEAADGTRTMTYEHQGRSYSIQYKPSATVNCWDFIDASYSVGGVSKSGTYCRQAR